jgi:tape measure domain-containing protein
VGIIAAGAAIAKVAIEVLKVADAYTAMANTLRSSTENAAELQSAQMLLIEQAAATTTTVESATASFNKLHDATEGLGLSQQEVIDLSTNLTQIMQLSGMSAEQATLGISRFADSLEDGAMNLKEFKLAMKESPELLKAMAAGLGVSVKELRLMAQQGTLTTQQMLEGLAKAAPEVAKKAAEMAPTMKAAFASVKSSFGAMIGEFNEGAGITESLARIVQGAGETLKEIAKKAQFVGIAFKVAVETVTIEMMAFIDGTIEGMKRVGIEIAQAIDFITPGKKFTAGLAKMEKDSKAHMDAIMENRKTGLADIQALANAAADATMGANKDTRSPVAAAVVTDEQIKGIKNFDDALLGLENKAVDALREMAALRMEMSKGKEVADSFRAQMAAGVAQADMTAKFSAAFKELKISLSDEQRAKLAKMIDLQVTSQIELKETAEAWALVNGAMNGAMTEMERANKATDELTRAMEKLKASGNLNEVQMALLGRALDRVKKDATKTADAFKDTIDAIKQQAIDAQAAIQTVQAEASGGPGAGIAARAQMQADIMARNLEKQTRKDMEGQGGITQKQIADIKESTKAQVDSEVALRSVEDAWADVSNVMNSALTPTQAAALEVERLNEQFEFLKTQLHLTDEQIALYKKGAQQIKDSTDMMKQGFKDAGRTLVSGFIDFLADGEFNFKRFATSMIQQISRIVIELLVMDAVRKTTWGAKLFTNAEGNAFNHGRLIPMASGGIVTAPTLFPMAGGNTGMMGEAGPEAVMPLARLSSGKLGVSAEPSNIQVINNTGVEARARIERSENRTSIILEAAQLGAQMAENRMTKSMRSGYGATSTALQGTYGLRRRG